MTTLVEKIEEDLREELKQFQISIAVPHKPAVEREHLSGRIAQIESTFGLIATLRKQQMQEEDYQPPGPGEQPAQQQKPRQRSTRARPWGAR